MVNKRAWKVLNKGMLSSYGNMKWRKNKWYHHDKKIKLCKSGFHASKRLIDAMQYTTPGIICRVEYQGQVLEENDKLVCTDMKIIKTYEFTKKMAIELAIFSARLCLHNFEKWDKTDKRPRKAIEAAKRYLKNPTQKNRSAARSAARSAESAARSAAWSSAGSAWSVVWSAAEFSAESAARSAARSARSVAESATRSAWSAVWCAAKSARSAARSDTKQKIENKLLKIIGARK